MKKEYTVESHKDKFIVLEDDGNGGKTLVAELPNDSDSQEATAILFASAPDLLSKLYTAHQLLFQVHKNYEGCTLAIDIANTMNKATGIIKIIANLKIISNH